MSWWDTAGTPTNPTQAALQPQMVQDYQNLQQFQQAGGTQGGIFGDMIRNYTPTSTQMAAINGDPATWAAANAKVQSAGGITGGLLRQGINNAPTAGMAAGPGTPTTASSGNYGQFFPNGQFSGDYQGYFNTIFPGGTVTAADLQAHASDLQRAGITLHPSTSNDNIVLPDGTLVDVIGDAGGANRKSWNPQTPGGGGGGLPGMDPSYDWRFQQGQKAVQGSAAARGTLLTGGTLKALAGYGQGMASTEYAADFGRQFGLAQLGENAAAGQGANNSGYATNATNALTNNANAQGAAAIAQGNTISGAANNLGSLYALGTSGQARYPGYPGVMY